MKRTLTFGLFSCIMLLTTIVCAQSQTREIRIQTNIYCDHCARCETCQERIENALLDQKGVKTAELDVKAQTITVAYNTSKTDEETIKKTINDAGYDADDSKASVPGYQALDACCKKSGATHD